VWPRQAHQNVKIEKKKPQNDRNEKSPGKVFLSVKLPEDGGRSGGGKDLEFDFGLVTEAANIDRDRLVKMAVRESRPRTGSVTVSPQSLKICCS
jgi:hypothetical protein